MKTTLNAIRARRPCATGWAKLLRHLGKTEADDEQLSIATVLDSNGLDDALWCLRAVRGYDREMRLFACFCARQVQHLMADPRSLAALDVAERYAHGNATEEELAAAKAAAMAAAWDAEMADAWNAARAAAREAAWNAAMAATWNAARAAAWNAAMAAARDAARDAAWDAQATRLREVIAEIEACDDRTPDRRELGRQLLGGGRSA